MFRELINSPIDPIPMEYVNTLCRLEREPDYSLTCLGIALLKHRFENYRGICGEYRRVDEELEAVNTFIDKFNLHDDSVPMFNYYIYSNKAENAEKILKEHGFEIKENVKDFIKGKANADCIVAYRKDKNCAAVFISTHDIRCYHIIISFLSLYYPKIFDKDPLTEEDKNVIKSCSKPERDVFVQRIQERVSCYTLEFRKMMLTTLLKTMHENKVFSALRDVDNQRSYLNSVMNTWEEAMAKLRELTIIYEGMKATENFDDIESEFIEYLSTNKLIHSMSMEGSVLKFSVATLLNNYNADAWQTFVNRGFIYDGDYRTPLLDVFQDKANRKMLLDNLFSETPEFAVKIAGNYRLDFQNNNVRTDRRYDYTNEDPMFKSYLPNPHLKIFSCLGGYEYKIADELSKRNYIVAVEMCCASAGSVNVEETEQTFRPFLGWIMSSREKILRRKDGVDMTPEEALIYLIDKEKNK